ncbi:MAG: glycosyl hydrolase [Armatimonadota bacterium]
MQPGMCKPITLAPEMGNLEIEWLFRTDPYDAGLKQGWMKPAFADTGWRKIKVPGNWEAQGVTDPRPGQPPQKNDSILVTDYDGVAWYRLHFIVPANWAGKELILRLGSVDDQDQVYLNGRLAGSTGPGIEQSVLLQRQYKIPASFIIPGKENVLAIRVSDGGGPGGMIGPFIFLLPESVMKTTGKLLQSNRPLEDRFINPPADCRMLKIIHSWPDEPDAQDSVISSLMHQGFGGVVCNVSFDDYLQSKTKWSAFKRALTESKKIGMAMWLYDEKGYPSGTAGKQTMIGHPDWEVSGFLIADDIVENGQVNIDVPPGKLVQVSAFPVTADGIDQAKSIDLTSQINGGKLSWKSPEGRWHVMVITSDRLYDHTFAAASFGDRIPYINMLMPEPTARFIELTHKQYVDNLGSDLGKYFISTFTDEPSLMNRWVDAAPYRAIPWSSNFPGEFMKRRGYDINPLIPLLAADSGEKSMKVRYDFWKTVGELVSENFFGQIQDFCKPHNISSGGHLVQEESILDHVAFYGNFFQCIRRMDAPGIDCLTSMPNQVPPHIARMISSVADLEGNKVTMSETSDFGQIYRSPGDKRPTTSVSEAEVRGTCNRLILGGINTITSYYSFNGLSSKEILRLNEWIGRCCTMLRGGNRSAEIAVLYPAESIWSRFNPSRSGATDSPSAMQIEQIFNSVSDTLYASRREFSYIDSKAIADARVENGYLVHGDLRWRVVILPHADTLPMSAWEKLRDFQKSGGVLIAVGALPANSDTEFPSARVKDMARAMFGENAESLSVTDKSNGVGLYFPAGSEVLLAGALDSIIAQDIIVDDQKSTVRVSHKVVDGYHVYFIINDSGKAWKGSISVPASGSGELYDPSNGKITQILAPDKVNLDLQPYDAVILRFTGVIQSKLKVNTVPLTMPETVPVQTMVPTVNYGEFVKAEVIPDSTHSKEGLPAWKTTATLTKGQTDTFSMVALMSDNLKIIDDYEFMSFDTWVPDGQKSPARLFVMLHEKSGSDYYLDTGRSLNMPGFHRLMIPFDHLQLAPWSKDVDGQLDLKSVQYIVIGWGGYFGIEGEKIEFSFTQPQVGRFK